MKSPRDHRRECKIAWRRYAHACRRGAPNAHELSRIYGEKHCAYLADHCRRMDAKFPALDESLETLAESGIVINGKSYPRDEITISIGGELYTGFNAN